MLKMQCGYGNKSIVIVQIERNTNQYIFCKVAISIYDFMLFDANFDERYLLDAINNGFKIPQFVHLKKKFFSGKTRIDD